MKNGNGKAPAKLSPQEDMVFNELRNRSRCGVFHLFVAAKRAKGDVSVKNIRALARMYSDRQLQQHVGVLVQRINSKRRRFVIKPGDEPRTYVMRRRRRD